MKVLTAAQIREADAYTIQHEPIASIDLMERAATACFDWITARYKPNRQFIVFAGPGNNGGDGLAIARKLSMRSYSVKVFILKISDSFSDDFKTNLKRLKALSSVDISEIKTEKDIPAIPDTPVIIDALFGSGLSRALTGIPAKIVDTINRSGNEVIAIDIPSGLFAEDNSALNTYEKTKPVINATHTITFQFPKLSFLFAENALHVGSWHVLPIGLHPAFINSVDSPYHLLDRSSVAPLIKKRGKFSHKGTYGHTLILAGSHGMAGAAVLSAKACLRTGAGLVSMHIPSLTCDIMQTAVPEAIVSLDAADTHISGLPEMNPYNAVGIGPGIGRHKETRETLKRLFETIHVPLVIDADALNIISDNKELLKLLPPHCILTPHPKEFTRLSELTYSDFERLATQIAFAKKHNVFLILKGAHTAIACPNGRCFFNTTGNPGMATGGSGDVLTGMIVSLLAQGYDPEEASKIGVYLHGLAGDIATAQSGQEALIASDIIENIGKAFVNLTIA